MTTPPQIYANIINSFFDWTPNPQNLQYIIYMFFFLSIFSVIVVIIRKILGIHDNSLLILDLNNVLIHCIPIKEVKERNIDTTGAIRVGNKYVWKRPFMEIFLDYFINRYDVAIWSSVRKDNLELLLDLLKPYSYKFKYIWDQSFCKRVTPHPNPNSGKPDILSKPLDNLKDQHTYKHVIIIDDCIYKMQENNPRNVIIIKKWEYNDKFDTELLKLIKTGIE